MSLLAPLFLLGILAIALPLWLHRMNFSDPPSLPFSSVRLMRHSQQTAATEQKLRYWLLLACRILALLILILLFAQPVFRSDSSFLAGSEQRHKLIVLDQSMSMRAPGVWRNAEEIASNHIADLSEFETAQIIGAGANIDLLTDSTAESSELTQALNRLDPSYSSLDYGQLVGTLDELVSRSDIPVDIVFITDAMESNLPVRFSDLVPNRAASLELEIAEGASQAINWAVTANYERNRVTANLTSFNGPAQSIEVELQVDEDTRAIQSIEVPASGSALAVFDELNLQRDETNLEVVIKPGSLDALTGDNSFYISSNFGDPVSVLVLEAGTTRESGVFLETALNSISDPVLETDIMAGRADINLALAEYDLVIASNTLALSDRVVTAMTSYIEGGGSLLAIADMTAQSGRQIDLTGHSFEPAATLSVTGGSQGLLIQQPLHGAISEFSGAIGAQLYQPQQLNLLDGDQVIISAGNGYPWLVEHSMGLGRVLLVAHSLLPSATDISLEPEFVPLLRSWVNYLSGASELPDLYATGDQIQVGVDIEAGRSAAVQQVFLPDGNPLLSLSQQSQIQTIGFDEPGIYGLQTSRGEHLVGVNTPQSESDLTPISDNLIAQWRSLSAGRETGNTGASGTTELVETSVMRSIENWLLPLLLLIILAESVLGNAHLKVRREVS